jgi:hypothetical protein
LAYDLQKGNGKMRRNTSIVTPQEGEKYGWHAGNEVTCTPPAPIIYRILLIIAQVLPGR